jgi:hypothetical protein
VTFEVSDENNSDIDAIKIKDLRTNKSLEYSKIELGFFKYHK